RRRGDVDLQLHLLGGRAECRFGDGERGRIPQRAVRHLLDAGRVTAAVEQRPCVGRRSSSPARKIDGARRQAQRRRKEKVRRVVRIFDRLVDRRRKRKRGVRVWIDGVRRLGGHHGEARRRGLG